MPLTDEDEIYERTFAGEDWSRRTMTRITFEACRFERCDFREANLTGAICTFTDFSRALFGKSILSGADFSDAGNFDIDVFDNQIVGAKFSRHEALRLLASLEIVRVD